MTRKIYIGSAWPYVNGLLHLGHVAGLLPADFLARYHRLQGDAVLWTSGSDCHGTPITVRAREEGRTPEEVAEEYHQLAVQTFEALGFSYSLYWETKHPNHHARVQASLEMLNEGGFVVEGEFSRAYCSKCDRNLADREVTGTCPNCESRQARGDQCENCGTEMTPEDLKNSKCSECFTIIEFSTGRELRFDLEKLECRLKKYVNAQTHWRDNAMNWTQGWLKAGLKPRSISRVIDWGIPITLDGWTDQRIYVWFEAVHGYLTASMEWAIAKGDPDAWKDFWLVQEGENDPIQYYVIGKDNIPFHSLLWPGILIAREENFVLPWHIVSSEYLGLEGKALSTSRNWAIWAPDFLEHHSADCLRYFLAANGPERKDTDFTWQGYAERVNNELIGAYGNLVNRVLSFTKKRFGGNVPDCGELAEIDKGLLSSIKLTFNEVAVLMEQTEFRKAIELVMSLAREANKYFQDSEPWAVIKSDPERAGTIINVAVNVVASLAILTEPFMPFQAEKLRKMLGGMNDRTWCIYTINSGTELGEIEILFEIIEQSTVDAEVARLKEKSTE